MLTDTRADHFLRGMSMRGRCRRTATEDEREEITEKGAYIRRRAAKGEEGTRVLATPELAAGNHQRGKARRLPLALDCSAAAWPNRRCRPQSMAR